MNKLAYMMMIVALPVAFACGGEEPGFGTCADLQQAFTPCGGDITGTWEIRDTCHEPLPALGLWAAWCPGAVADATLDANAIIEIDDTMIRFGAMTIMYDGDVLFQEQCLADRPIDCVGLEQELDQEPDVVATCVEEGADCRCRITAVTIEPASAVDYATEGTEVLLEDGSERFSYCVSGKEMIWQAPNDDSPVTHVIWRKR
jgi:hypothetical protein